MSKEGRGVASEYVISGSVDQAQVKALNKALKDTGHAAKNELRHDLKEAGIIVQKEIQSRTPVYGGTAYKSGKGARRATVELRGESGKTKVYKGTHTPGLLKRSTRVRTYSSLRIEVYNNAKGVSAKYPGGYRYGKRLEFDPAFKSKYAFFYPGYEAARAKSLALFNKVLQAAVDAYVKK